MYDYIIIGAGSAGCVLANRLSADPTKRVCLIEAGSRDRNPLIHVPLGLAMLSRVKSVNWGHDTAPEGNLGNRKLFWPRGRTLGGSSSINGMIYIRGHSADYDGWKRAAGPDWGWDRARELFLRMEGNASIDNAHHNPDGPLSVSDLRCVNPLSKAFVEAGIQCQFPHNRDFNGAIQEGVGTYQVTQRDGQRCSSARAFLNPVRNRPNLIVETRAQVERVIFKDRHAVGVALTGRNIMTRPGGEVILCAGAINSPQLLMLSGVGPASQLARHGIEVIYDAPEVGENLADHLDITVMSSAKGRLGIGIAPSFVPRALVAARRYWTRHTGELTSNAAEAGGFVKSEPMRDRPNLQFHFIPAYLRDHGRKATLGYGVTLHVCDLMPKSRGRVTLSDADSLALARIEPNYLSHPDDIKVLLDGLKIARRIMAAPALARHIQSEVLPGPMVQSDAQLIADIRARAESIYHPVGTCRMGVEPASVVDPKACVRGVHGLRVVDASVMPSIIAGNTSAPTMMIAENVADMMTGA